MHVIAHPIVDMRGDLWIVECSEHGFIAVALPATVDAVLASHSASHAEVSA